MKTYEVGFYMGYGTGHNEKNHAIDEKGFPLCRTVKKGFTTYKKHNAHDLNFSDMDIEVTCKRCLNKIFKENYTRNIDEKPYGNEMQRIICFHCDGNGCEHCNTTGHLWKDRNELIMDDMGNTVK